VIITSRQNDPSLFADKSQGNVHAEVDSLPNIAIESTIGRASRRDGASSDRPDADACRRRVSTKRYIRARARARTPLVRHGMWSGSRACTRERECRRALCYSSRFLSLRNALAIIAART